MVKGKSKSVENLKIFADPAIRDCKGQYGTYRIVRTSGGRIKVLKVILEWHNTPEGKVFSRKVKVTTFKDQKGSSIEKALELNQWNTKVPIDSLEIEGIDLRNMFQFSEEYEQLLDKVLGAIAAIYEVKEVIDPGQ